VREAFPPSHLALIPELGCPGLLLCRDGHRGDCQWRDDDYDLLEDGVIVGRIFKVPVAPQDRPWMWASGHNGDIKRASHGYAEARVAMGAFTKSWRRE
jgi:hypothetical protein